MGSRGADATVSGRSCRGGVCVCASRIGERARLCGDRMDPRLRLRLLLRLRLVRLRPRGLCPRLLGRCTGCGSAGTSSKASKWEEESDRPKLPPPGTGRCLCCLADPALGARFRVNCDEGLRAMANKSESDTASPDCPRPCSPALPL